MSAIFRAAAFIRGEVLVRGRCLFQCGHPKERHLFEAHDLLEEIQYYSFVKFQNVLQLLMHASPSSSWVEFASSPNFWVILRKWVVKIIFCKCSYFNGAVWYSYSTESVITQHFFNSSIISRSFSFEEAASAVILRIWIIPAAHPILLFQNYKIKVTAFRIGVPLNKERLYDPVLFNISKNIVFVTFFYLFQFFIWILYVTLTFQNMSQLTLYKGRYWYGLFLTMICQFILL